LDVLSFWPSLGLLVFFLVIFLECRTIAGRVTLPLGSFLMVFCYGAIGAPLLALLLQQVPFFPASSAAWLVGPPVEELAKALPVLVLAFLMREGRRLSIADLTLVGFASGAGFGFVEGNFNALVNGTLPSVQHLTAFGLQSANGTVFFAGHPVSTALVGLAAGIGVRFIPLNIGYAWVPSVFVILWASFDHGLYNWKVLSAAGTGALPSAHFVVELFHLLTLNGQLQTWVLVLGLLAAQFVEAYLCSKAVGVRRDLLLAREWRPWVINEWLVVLLRLARGRAVFGQTLAYFRLRRAFYLAALEDRRDSGDPTWSRHARSLEDRLKRERSILFDPPPGTWLLPLSVLQLYAVQWTWRMRWVLLFTVLLLLLFMLDPRSLPDEVREFLFGQTFTIAVVTAGLAFAVWRIVLFVRQPAPDPLAADGAAHAGYYTRAMLLGCAFVCGLFPTLTMLLGWKAFAPGAAFISSYLPGWIGQGGNLQTLLGLGAIGSAVAPDPRPAGEAFRHEIAAGEERIRRLGSDIEDTTGGAQGVSSASSPVQLDAFLDAMAKLDTERDAQARRQLALDECERHAGEATIRDPTPAIQAVKDEFDRLAGELLDAAAKELDAMATLEQAYGRAWAEIMRDLDAHDVLRRRLRNPLRRSWQAQNDVAWALRVVEATDETLLPMQLTLLPDLHALASTAQSARTDLVMAGIERIRAAAAEYGEADPFGLAGPEGADEDEAALLAEFAPSAEATETAKAFGLRTAKLSDVAAEPRRDKTKPARPETSPEIQTRGPYQTALDQLIDAPKHDAHYLETIRHLERSHESLQKPVEPAEEKPQPIEPAAKAEEPREATQPRTEQPEDAPAKGPSSKPQGELEDLLDTIKRESGYLQFGKKAQAAEARDDRGQPKTADAEPASHDAPTSEVAVDTAPEAPQHEAVAASEDQTADEPSAAPSSPKPVAEPASSETKAAASTSEEAPGAEAREPSQPVRDTDETKPASTAPEQADEPAAPVSAVSADLEKTAADTEAPASSDERPKETPPVEKPHPHPVKDVDLAKADDSAVVEPRRPVEAKKPLGQDRDTDRAEHRPSAFAKLFHSIRRQSDSSTAKPARWHDRPQAPDAKHIDAKLAEPLAPSHGDDRAPALSTENKVTETEAARGDIAAPTAEWLADFASPKSDDVTARAGEPDLARIEWPTVGPTTPDVVPATASDAAAPQVDVSEPVEIPAAEVEPTHSGRPAPDGSDAPGASERTEAGKATAPEPQTSQVTGAQALKPEGADEFGSKADRLSHLLDKLEQAMQAKSPVPTPADPQPAPVAEKAPSSPERAQADETSIVAEPEALKPTAQADQPEHPTAPIAEAPTAAAEPDATVEAKAAASQTASDERTPHTPSVSVPSSEHEETPEAALKPDRLSFLLTKLFEAVKRQPTDQPASPTIDAFAAPRADTAPEEPEASAILDLRGAHPIPETPEQAEPTPSSEPEAPQLSAGAQEPSQAPAAPGEPAVASEPQEAEIEKTVAESTEAERPAVSRPVVAPDDSPAASPAQPSEQPVEPAPVEPAPKPRVAEPATRFGSRSRPPRPGGHALARDREKKRSVPERPRDPPESEAPATTPKRDWKLTSPARGETKADSESNDSAPKKPEPTFRVKTGSGALATTDAAPAVSSAASANLPGKYYGPRLAKGVDDELGANSPANQRALSLADALTEFYAKAGQPQPPMHTTDRATLQRIVAAGKLEAPRRRGAAWSTSGMSRRGDVAIRLKPGAEQFIEFVPSTEIFGQVPHYYPRGVGKGSYATHVPAAHLEYFDVTTRQWAPLVRGRE
jgi:RsiW-degrading membrane proteinase PrsW (M82 family)